MEGDAFSEEAESLDYTTWRDTTNEHVIAETKLSQLFTALTAIVPGIKEMDVTTVLDASMGYIKQLQSRVQKLEDQASQNHADSESSSSDDNFSNELLPRIEARVSDRNVLIRIHCEIRKGVLLKALEEIEKLHLSVVNSSVMPFGASTLDITLMAQMDNELMMTVKDLVKSLRSSLIQFLENNLPKEHGN